MKKTLSLIMVLVMVFSLCVIANADSENIIPGGTLVIATTTDASTINIYEMRGFDDGLFMDHLYESLMRFDENGTPTPFLAESVIGDPENLTYTIQLKKGILFHDGSELNAEVCKWNLDMYKEYGVLSSSFMEKFESIEVAGEYTVIIHLSEWDPFVTNNLARPTGCGYMASKKAYDEHGLEWLKNNPVSTSPFKFVSWERDVQLTLTKFDDYWRGTPYLDGMKIVVYSSPLVEQAAFENGEAHIIYNASIDMAEYLKANDYNVVSTSIPASCYTLCYNCVDETSPLSNVKVRKAMSYAIDSQEIADAIFGDYAKVSTQYAWPGNKYYNDTVNFDCDIEKAKELLAEAGYPDGFSTVIYTVAVSPYVDIVQIAAEELAQIGIQIEIENVDLAGYLSMINGWEKGIFIHPMGMAAGPAAQVAANFVQGLKSGIGVTSLLHTDEMNSMITEGLKKSGTEFEKTFQDVQKLIFDDYCMIKVIACVCTPAAISPILVDCGFGDICSTTSDTLHLAHFIK